MCNVPLEAHVFQHLDSSRGAILEYCGTFRGDSRAGGNGPLGNIEVHRPALLPVHFLFPDSTTLISANLTSDPNDPRGSARCRDEDLEARRANRREWNRTMDP